jgi:hypothetical protein
MHGTHAPGERRPTGKNARNSHKAGAVGRPLHWVVRQGKSRSQGFALSLTESLEFLFFAFLAHAMSKRSF